MSLLSAITLLPSYSMAKTSLPSNNDLQNVELSFFYNKKNESIAIEQLKELNNFVKNEKYIPLNVMIEFDKNIQSQLQGYDLYVISSDFYNISTNPFGFLNGTFNYTKIENQDDIVLNTALPTSTTHNIQNSKSLYIFCISKNYEYSVIRLDLPSQETNKNSTNKSMGKLGSHDKFISNEQRLNGVSQAYKNVTPFLYNDVMTIKIKITSITFQ